jgi:hypothetical protein
MGTFYIFAILAFICLILHFRYVAVVNHYKIVNDNLVVKNSLKTVEIPINTITKITKTNAGQIAISKEQSKYIPLNNPMFPFFPSGGIYRLAADAIIITTNTGKNYVLYFSNEDRCEDILSMINKKELIVNA